MAVFHYFSITRILKVVDYKRSLKVNNSCYKCGENKFIYKQSVVKQNCILVILFFSLLKTSIYCVRQRPTFNACAKQSGFVTGLCRKAEENVKWLAHVQKRYGTDFVNNGCKSCPDRGGTDTGRATGAILMDRGALFVQVSSVHYKYFTFVDQCGYFILLQCLCFPRIHLTKMLVSEYIFCVFYKCYNYLSIGPTTVIANASLA